jgi:hypothetical protein
MLVGQAPDIFQVCNPTNQNPNMPSRVKQLQMHYVCARVHVEREIGVPKQIGRNLRECQASELSKLPNINTNCDLAGNMVPHTFVTYGLNPS